MNVFEIVLLIVLASGAVWIFTAVVRQGHPEDERSIPERAGPTGEPYPPGSGPAGPGAERMTSDPPEVPG